METISEFIKENPSGLLRIKQPLSIPEYRENMGFGLKNTFKIFESKDLHFSGEDWFAFSNNSSLEDLFKVQETSEGDLLVVFIVESIKGRKVYCNLILSDEAFQNLLKTQKAILVHQMYFKFWKDNIALNCDFIQS